MHYRGDTQPVVIRLTDGEEGLVTESNALPITVLTPIEITAPANLPVTTQSGSLITLTGTNTVVIVRQRSVVNFTIANGQSESAEIDMTGKAGGSIFVPNPWTAANIGFKKATVSGGTFVWARDDTGALIQITNVQAAEADSYQIPDSMFGSGYIKVVSCTALGVAVNQGADRAMSAELVS